MDILKLASSQDLTADMQMDIARYNIDWYLMASIQHPKALDVAKEFAKNLQSIGPTEIIVTKSDEKKFICYIYVFPDQETHKRFLKETTDYEKFEPQSINN